MPCCPVLLSLYCIIIIVFLNEINGDGDREVEIWADTVKFTNAIVTGFRKCRNLV